MAIQIYIIHVLCYDTGPPQRRKRPGVGWRKLQIYQSFFALRFNVTVIYRVGVGKFPDLLGGGFCAAIVQC